MKGDFQVPPAFVQALRENKSFLLVSHVGLDGDHLGSMLALQQALTILGKKVAAFLPESIPPSLSRILFGLEHTSTELPDEKFDAVIALE